jgi:hypothetical protein
MKKRTFDVSFKNDVLDYMETENCSVYKAAKHFSALHRCVFSEQMFGNWKRHAESIKATHSSKKRASGGGRRPTLDGVEDMLADEVVEDGDLFMYNKIEREIELDELEQELEDDDIHIDYDLHARHLD